MAEVIATPPINLATPSLRIAGIPLSVTNFSWALTPGPRPYSVDFVAPRGGFIETDLRQVRNPVNLELKVDGGVTSQKSTKTLLFEDLFLHDIRAISEFEIKFKVSDVRFNLRGKKLYYGFNMTRISNDFGLLRTPTTELVGEVDPSVLRIPFDRFRRGRYLPQSVKDDGTPFTVSEAIKIVVAGLGLRVVQKPGVDLSDGDYKIENLVAEGADVYSGLASLLAKGRLNLGINPDGTVYLYSVDFFDDTQFVSLLNLQNLAKIMPGTLYRQDLRRVRPEKISVRFEKLLETRVVYQSVSEELSFEEDPPRPTEPIDLELSSVVTEFSKNLRTTIGCTNVIRVPFVPTEFVGQVNIGEYMPMDKYLNMIGIDDAFVRENWFTNILERKFSFILSDGQNVRFEIDVLAHHVIRTIRDHYRKVFQLDTFFIDRFKKWEARRATVVDTFTGYRPPSPLWADYTYFPRGRDIDTARGRVVDFEAAKVYFVDVEDPDRERPTLGTITMVDHDLGIFRVDYPPVTDTMIAEVVPSGLDNPPFHTPGFGPTTRTLLAEADLSENFTMETIVSMVWHWDISDNFDSVETQIGPGAKYFDFVYDYSNHPTLGISEGPPIDFLTRKEYARFAYNPEIDDLEISNFDIIRSLSEAESAKIIHQFQDRIVGTLVVPGALAISLDGNLKSITYMLNEEIGLGTMVDLSEIPPDPQVIQLLSDDARRYLYRQLDRGGP